MKSSEKRIDTGSGTAIIRYKELNSIEILLKNNRIKKETEQYEQRRSMEPAERIQSG